MISGCAMRRRFDTLPAAPALPGAHFCPCCVAQATWYSHTLEHAFCTQAVQSEIVVNEVLSGLGGTEAGLGGVDAGRAAVPVPVTSKL